MPPFAPLIDLRDQPHADQLPHVKIQRVSRAAHQLGQFADGPRPGSLEGVQDFLPGRRAEGAKLRGGGDPLGIGWRSWHD